QQIGWVSFWKVLVAAGLFCIISSAIYLINDLRDIELDRAHPKKRYRPIAAGEVPVSSAILMSVLLATTALVTAYLFDTRLLLVILTYFIMQLAYTLGLKKIALVDLFVIAFGFVLRALAGAVALQVYISPWLLLCTLLLALFLGLCKRRHEKVVLADLGGNTRDSLENYDTKLLDQLIGIVSAAVIVFYSIYTLWPETINKYNTSNLAFTIPFVLFGLFRYLDLVYQHEKGDRPEKILLTDIPLIIDLLLYGAAVLLILLLIH
ncbi:MAG: UbiA family prenyltransferase, partial [Kiritimatiellae bacterium]|nr:UbiA family prenyltransferase [Kiritimatiellia bacterium]